MEKNSCTIKNIEDCLEMADSSLEFVMKATVLGHPRGSLLLCGHDL